MPVRTWARSRQLWPAAGRRRGRSSNEVGTVSARAETVPTGASPALRSHATAIMPVPALKHLCRSAIIATSLIAATGCEGTRAPPPVVSRAPPDLAAVRRGEYLAVAANCAACHTAQSPGAAPFAGGRDIPTPFGSYYSSNITSDTATGIGAWSDQDFLSALRDGVSPSGKDYFPVFPFTSFTLMSDPDILDVRAYLSTVPAVSQA